MDKLTVGIVAHVDAGKTTLSEALLYRGGALRKLGRVDHADAFLDTGTLERERGITIFSKQAVLPREGLELTLLDTPGHADFSSEMERVLGVLDCALLVVSGPDGPQGHTLTLWKLLERHHVPTVLFLNKMDQAGADREALLDRLRAALSDVCLDMSCLGQSAFWEEAALGDEDALEEYMETDQLSDDTLRRLVGQRKLFPCFFGSALKVEGVDELLEGIRRFVPVPRYGPDFAARVFKITHEGGRLTHLKITGGTLNVKDLLADTGEKVDQIRIYSGAKFKTVDEAQAGTVCVVTGPLSTRPGQALGAEVSWVPPMLEPALSYQMILPPGCDPHGALRKLRELEEEDPQLHLEWNARLGELHLRLMGRVQAEILKRVIAERFGLEVEFGPGSIVYRETIAAPVEGVGHFEPLRHYAEVHILLEPLPRGSGIQLAACCPSDLLDLHWQRLILSHLTEKPHLGVLTGSPITDVRLTLVSGRDHIKHTEPGDFRQATYRAVRQGLMNAESILLEPWYDFRLELPTASLGRAMADLQRMGGEAQPARTVGDETVLTGSAPVCALRDYAAEVASYTRGHGRLTCTPGSYRPCPEQEQVVKLLDYDPVADLENTPDSVFCAHGGGFPVPWDEVPAHMHLPFLDLSEPMEEEIPPPQPQRQPQSYREGVALDAELQAIFEKTYGAVKPRAFQPPPKPRKSQPEAPKRPAKPIPAGPEFLLVDGYNIIFAWDELKAIARDSLDSARKVLMDLLSNYQGYRKNHIILVFDAYKVPQGTGSVVKYHNIHVVYTKEAETADSYIERASYQLTREQRRVKVATSDGAEQMIIMGHGALRLSAADLKCELEQAEGEIAALIRSNNKPGQHRSIQAALEQAKNRQK